jgi:hypothetical protein
MKEYQIIEKSLDQLNEAERKRLYTIKQLVWKDSAWSWKRFNEHLEKYPRIMLALIDKKIVGFLTFNEKIAGSITTLRTARKNNISKDLILAVLKECPEILIEVPQRKSLVRLCEIFGFRHFTSINAARKALRGIKKVRVSKEDGKVVIIKSTKRGTTEKKWLLRHHKK